MLEIEYDYFFPENPRRMDETLGYFVTCESKSINPDKDKENGKTIERIIKEESEEASDFSQHSEKVKARIEEELGETVHSIYPVTSHEHGLVRYYRGQGQGFDYSLCGMYIVTEETGDVSRTQIEEVIDGELDEYTQWANGGVYCATLYDNNGEVIEQLGNMYGLNEIKEELTASYDGWEDENMEDYML